MAEEQETRQGKLYGRKWKISIYKPAYVESTDDEGNEIEVRDPEHDIEMDVSQLKCVFQTTASIDSQAAQVCTLAVYNMNATTEREVIQEGFQISIYAGYQEGQYGEVFTGDIVQVFRNREDGINYRLEIIAIRGMKEFCGNFIRTTIGAGSSPRYQAEAAAKRADAPIAVETVTENMSEQKLPRGKVLFGTPEKYLRDICMWNNAFFWTGDDGKMELRAVDDEIPKDKCIDLTPNTGLIGTPVYTDGGINIKMLLDPRVKFYTLIKIDNEIIQRQAIQMGNAMAALNGKTGAAATQGLNQNLVFDQDGEYMVFKVTHSGDTWGEEWTTTVTACSRSGRNASVPLAIAQNGATEVR